MRLLLIFLVCTSFTFKKSDFVEIDQLMHVIQHKANDGTLDKEKIKKWLKEQECLIKKK